MNTEDGRDSEFNIADDRNSEQFFQLLEGIGNTTFGYLNEKLTTGQILQILSEMESDLSTEERIEIIKSQPPDIYAALRALSLLRMSLDILKENSFYTLLSTEAKGAIDAGETVKLVTPVDELIPFMEAVKMRACGFIDGLSLGLVIDGPVKEELKKAAEKAGMFIGKGRSIDEFSRLLMKILSEEYRISKKFPDWNTVKNHLKQLEGHGVVAIVDESKALISLAHGEPVSFGGLKERLTRIRKTIRNEK